MKKVKIFTVDTVPEIENTINNFIEEENFMQKEIVDVKISQNQGWQQTYFLITLIYEENFPKVKPFPIG